MSALVSLSTSSLSFGNVNINTSSSVLTVTVTNTGNATLTITSVAIVGSADFSQTNTLGTSILAGNNGVISVTFSPTPEGIEGGLNETASIVLTTNAPSSPDTITLSGTAVLIQNRTNLAVVDANGFTRYLSADSDSSNPNTLIISHSLCDPSTGVRQVIDSDGRALVTIASGITPDAGTPGTVSIANTDYTALAANANRQFLLLQNTSLTAYLYFTLNGSSAWSGSALQGHILGPTGSIVLDTKVSTAAIHVASASAGATYYVTEG